MSEPQQQQAGGAEVVAPVDSPKKKLGKLLDEVLAQPYNKRQATEANSVTGGDKSISGAVNWGFVILLFFICRFDLLTYIFRFSFI